MALDLGALAGAPDGADARSAAPAVRFGDGRRPESSTQVRMESFDGPLALLLTLIEARQLDVVTVPLGALADAYLDALASLEINGAFLIRNVMAQAVAPMTGAQPEHGPNAVWP